MFRFKGMLNWFFISGPSEGYLFMDLRHKHQNISPWFNSSKMTQCPAGPSIRRSYVAPRLNHRSYFFIQSGWKWGRCRYRERSTCSGASERRDSSSVSSMAEDSVSRGMDEEWSSASPFAFLDFAPTFVKIQAKKSNTSVKFALCPGFSESGEPGDQASRLIGEVPANPSSLGVASEDSQPSAFWDMLLEGKWVRQSLAPTYNLKTDLCYIDS